MASLQPDWAFLGSGWKQKSSQFQDRRPELYALLLTLGKLLKLSGSSFLFSEMKEVDQTSTSKLLELHSPNPRTTYSYPLQLLNIGIFSFNRKNNSQRQIFVVVVQSLSCVGFFATPWTAVCQASLSSTISQSLLRFTCIELVMPSNHLILCCHLLLLPSIFPSIRVFSNESDLFQ